MTTEVYNDKAADVNPFLNYRRVVEELWRVEQHGIELDRNEHYLLLFILERTLRFKKPMERITYDQFIHGVYDKEGRLVIQGTRLNKRTLMSALAKLKDLGLLLKEAVNDRIVRYGLAESFLGRLLGCSNAPTIGASMHQSPDQSLVQQCTSKQEKKTLNRKQTERLPVASGSGVIDIGFQQGENIVDLQQCIAAAKQKNRDRRSNKAKSLATNFTLQNLNALWVELMLKNFPECRTPGRFNTKLFTGPFRAGLKSQGLASAEDAIDLLTYSVENWSYLYEFCGWNRLDLFATEPTPSAIARGVKILVEARNRRESAAKHYSSATAVTRLRIKQERDSLHPVRKPMNLNQYDSPDPEGDQEDDDGFFAKRFHRDLQAAL